MSVIHKEGLRKENVHKISIMPATSSERGEARQRCQLGRRKNGDGLESIWGIRTSTFCILCQSSQSKDICIHNHLKVKQDTHQNWVQSKFYLLALGPFSLIGGTVFLLIVSGTSQKSNSLLTLFLCHSQLVNIPFHIPGSQEVSLHCSSLFACWWSDRQRPIKGDMVPKDRLQSIASSDPSRQADAAFQNHISIWYPQLVWIHPTR